MSPRLRPALASDYDAIAAVVDAWWGRPVLTSLPRLFLDHFHRTSLIAESDGGGLAGFLVGIISPSEPAEAYIHFVGVSPAMRGTGLARTLYAEFFGLARAQDRSVVRAVTSPVNAGSISFHLRMGFAVTGPVPAYNGPGHDLVVFERVL